MSPVRTPVLLLVPSLIHGGAQRVFSTLLRHLDRERFEIHLALFEAKGPYLKDVPGDVIVHDLKVARIRYALPAIVRVVRKVRPRTVLSTLAWVNLQLLLARPVLPRGTRVVVRESTDPHAFLNEQTRYPRLWAWMIRRLYRKADHVVCLSDAMLSELASRFNIPGEKLVRIYNQVDTEMIRALGAEGANPFSGLGPNLVTAGRFSWEKGLDVLLEAMPRIVQRHPAARLVILGDGPLEADLREQAERLKLMESVCFAGFQQNPWPWLRHADLCIQPSRYEGLPNTLLEALALGTAVIGTDCPGALQEIRSAGAPIHLAPPENPAALAEAVSSFCDQRQGTSLPQETRQPWMDRFELEQVVAEYERLL